MSQFTNYPNGITSFGAPVMGGSIPFVFGYAGVGNYYFVDPTNGSNDNAGTSPRFAFATVEKANAVAISGDTIVMSTNTGHAVATGLLVATSRVNFVGADFGSRYVQQGSRIELSGAVDSAYALKVTGTRDSFSNIKIIQSSTHANALTVYQAGGEGTMMNSCSVVFGVANNLGSTSAYEVVMGEDSGSYSNCYFGTDVLLTSAARTVMLLKKVTGGSSADGAKSNVFVDCKYKIMSSDANATCIKLNSTSDAKFLNEWTRPRFTAVINQTNSAVVITNAIASASGFVEGTLAFYQPATFNFTNGCASVTDKVVVTASVASSNSWEGVTAA